MKTGILIIIGVVLSVAVIFGGVYVANVIQNMENQKFQEEWRELRASIMSDLGKQKKCEEMGGSWNTDHCLITQETFDSNKLTCEPGTVLEDATCQSNGIKLVFEPAVESKTTGGIFYPRIHISILPDTESTQYVDPDFVTIGPDSQVTWSNYDDVPVSINSVDPDNAWSTTVIPPDGYDTVTFEETGIYEYKGNEGIHGFIIVMDDDDPTRHVRDVYFSDWYDLDELHGLGCGQPILSHLYTYSNLLDEEFSGKYAMEDIGLSDGMSVEKFNECAEFIFEKRMSYEFDKTWGGPGNRHPTFLGYDIPEICTEDMIKHLAKYSTMFERGIPYGLDWVGLGESIDPDDFDKCVDELLKRNPKTLENKNGAFDQLKGVLGNCACQERVLSNPDTMERCPQPYISWENSTHYINNNICEWQKDSVMIDILDRCEQIKETGTFGGFAYGASWQNDTHYIDNTTCEWKNIK